MIDANVPRFLRSYWKFKYASLLGALLLVLLAMPLAGRSLQDQGLTRVFFVVVMLACIATTARTRYVMAVATLLAVVGEWTSVVPVEVGKACHVTLFFLVSVIVLADVLRVEEVNSDKILGAICGYLLMGVAFGILYGLIEVTYPGSFSVAKPSFSTLTYFSFVTISTLGYGDVLAVGDAARALVTMEATTGQFYIAIVVARLLSLHLMVNPPASLSASKTEH